MPFLDFLVGAAPAARTAEQLAALNLREILQELIDRWAQEGLEDMRAATPVDTERMKRAWQVRPGDLAAELVNATSYGRFVLEGTRPHDVPGAFGLPLPFGIGGRFGGKFHPGTRPNAALGEALEQLLEQALELGPQAAETLVARVMEGA